MKRVFNLVAAALVAAGLSVAAVQPAQAKPSPSVAASAVKGHPTQAGASSSKASLAGPTFLYNNATQTPAAGTLGVYSADVIAAPTGVPNDGSHSIAEISVESGTALRNIVEVGWSVSPSQFGDSNPHLFVFWWKNGIGQCYNGCGFVSAAGTYVVGQSLASLVGTSVTFGIEHIGTAWWVGFNGVWVGNFPDSLWTNSTPSGPSVTFNTVGYYQVFGEIARAGTPAPSTICTDMGNGILGTVTTSPLPDKWSNTMLRTSTGTLVDASLTAPSSYPNPTYWAGSLITAKTYRFGGPGAC
jgi:Neprosin